MTGTPDLSLRIVRRLPVAPEVVFDAFTNPESMRIWWGESTTFDIDLRVGGRWTVTRRDGENEFVATGEYLEIQRPHGLVYGYSMPQFSPNTDKISIDIASDGDGSVVTFEVTGEDIAAELKEVPPGSISASEEGWRQGFDLLEAAWSKSEPKSR